MVKHTYTYTSMVKHTYAYTEVSSQLNKIHSQLLCKTNPNLRGV